MPARLKKAAVRAQRRQAHPLLQAKENVTISFGTHQSGYPSCGVLQDLADQFEEETGIKIDFQVSPDAQWRDLLKVKLDSGEAPDIFCVDADPLSLYSVSARMRPAWI